MEENSARELINQNTLNKSYKYLSIYNLITEINQLHLKYISFSKTNNIKELDSSLILSSNDIKLIYFIFKYLNNSLKNNIYILSNIKFTSKIINDQNNNLLNHSLISKFINFLLLNPKINEQFFNIKGINNINEDIFKNKIYHIMKLLFLKGNLSTSEVNMILLTNLLTCFNSNNNIIENTIKNIQPLYSIINFFLSFINITNHISENNLKKYNDLVSNFINNLNKYILSNNNNLFSLSRNNQIFKLIQLDKISVSLKHIIIPLLVNVYKYKFNIDIVFEGINSQFLLYNNENIEQKTNLMMAKNIFLNNLFSQEKSLLCGKEFYIRNGFYFNDFENNGIICSSMNTFSKEGYTIVLSFNLKYNKNNKKYNIFSIFREKNIIRLYIENNKLFLNTCNNQNIELFNDIKYDNDYVFWMVHPNKKKLQLLFYLNNNINFINNINCYPSDNYGISLGFDKKSNNPDNFIGIIGTFILFNKCLIENKNDNQNETKLISLKGNYESLLYINTKRDFANYDKNTNLILNKYSLIEDISKYIEITISNKSIVNNILFGEMHREFNCNYFDFNKSGNNNKFYFNNFQSVINNLNYIVEYKNSLEQFLFNHGILYL